MESIGRWTSTVDSNPPGVLRVGLYQELQDGKPVTKLISTPAMAAGDLTLTALGESRYRLTIRAKPAGPSLGFSLRATDNTVFQNASTQLFCLPGYPQYIGKEPLTFLQLSETQTGILCRIGH